MLTEQEKAILDKLKDAHNEYVKLPIMHPSDTQEWVHSFHNLQNIIMSRVAVRSEPDYFFHIETNT